MREIERQPFGTFLSMGGCLLGKSLSPFTQGNTVCWPDEQGFVHFPGSCLPAQVPGALHGLMPSGPSFAVAFTGAVWPFHRLPFLKAAPEAPLNLVQECHSWGLWGRPDASHVLSTGLDVTVPYSFQSSSAAKSRHQWWTLPPTATYKATAGVELRIRRLYMCLPYSFHTVHT